MFKLSRDLLIRMKNRKCLYHTHKKSRSLLKTSDLSPFYQFLANVLKVWFIKRYYQSFYRTTSYLKINLLISLVILVSISYYPLLKKYFQVLLIITKFQGYSLTYKKLSIKCDTRELLINLKTSGSQVIY